MQDSTREITTELTLSDMRVINNIIEFVAVKGLIKAGDFTTIGNIYDKITVLLKNNDSSAQQ